MSGTELFRREFTARKWMIALDISPQRMYRALPPSVARLLLKVFPTLATRSAGEGEALAIKSAPPLVKALFAVKMLAVTMPSLAQIAPPSSFTLLFALKVLRVTTTDEALMAPPDQAALFLVKVLLVTAASSLA